MVFQKSNRVQEVNMEVQEAIAIIGWNDWIL